MDHHNDAQTVLENGRALSESKKEAGKLTKSCESEVNKEIIEGHCAGSHYIYTLSDPRTMKVLYVGKTVSENKQLSNS